MRIKIAVLSIAALCLLSGCVSHYNGEEIDLISSVDYSEDYVEVFPEVPAEFIALSQFGSMFLVEELSAPGTEVFEKNTGLMDFSNAKDGYIMIKSTVPTTDRIVIQVTGPSGVMYQYTNVLGDGNYYAIPLSDGSGQYGILFGQVMGSKNAIVFNTTFDVALTDEFAPFLRPNIMVDYTNAPNTVALGQALCEGQANLVDKVASIYNYMVLNFTYDYDLAAQISAGLTYQPVLDVSLANAKGVCYDYAALTTAMLRSQGIPCKMIFGYPTNLGGTFHAWIDAYSDETGWINNLLSFDGVNWRILDPTFASTGGAEGTELANERANYPAKFIY